MGAESRRGETVAVAAELAKYRPVFPIETPALIDGGDVVTMGRRLFVGSSRRTNQAGAAALKKILEPFGYEVQTVELDGCLHLKSACTAITSDTLLVNPACVNSGLFHPLKTVAIPAGEEAAADVLTVGDVVILPQGFPRTRAMLEAMKIEVRCVNVSEFQKAEAGVTCLSIVFASGATDLD
jgi:dimethylargininase